MNFSKPYTLGLLMTVLKRSAGLVFVVILMIVVASIRHRRAPVDRVLQVYKHA